MEELLEALKRANSKVDFTSSDTCRVGRDI